MYLYVFMYVCRYVCMYVCAYVCVYLQVHLNKLEWRGKVKFKKINFSNSTQIVKLVY